MLRLKNLGSGSSGNATLMEGSDGLHTRRLLVDCGLGIRRLEARLAEAGLATGPAGAGGGIGLAHRAHHRGQPSDWNAVDHSRGGVAARDCWGCTGRLEQPPQKKTLKMQKPRFFAKAGLWCVVQATPCGRLRPLHELLGLRSSAGSSSGCSVSSSLGSVSSRSGFSGSSRSGFGGSRSGFRSGRCWSWSGCSHGSWSWSGFFFFTASGQGSSSDQGGQNDGVLHFKFPSWTDKKLEKPRRPAG